MGKNIPFCGRGGGGGGSPSAPLLTPGKKLYIYIYHNLCWLRGGGRASHVFFWVDGWGAGSVVRAGPCEGPNKMSWRENGNTFLHHHQRIKNLSTGAAGFLGCCLRRFWQKSRMKVCAMDGCLVARFSQQAAGQGVMRVRDARRKNSDMHLSFLLRGSYHGSRSAVGISRQAPGNGTPEP